ncbi:hypothetical protein [Vallitalea sp.]|jgi:uncharacterized protein YxeA|uniref:hypothetical protein n=1 Tax=Vallitalea sp. TaxID=1882829 RepID=UPI0025D4602E|nr:hypothetical protein [Vallitalea sp.]MCT4688294.1 hypothetical protein [Vallitalea sp.]
MKKFIIILGIVIIFLFISAFLYMNSRNDVDFRIVDMGNESITQNEWIRDKKDNYIYIHISKNERSGLYSIIVLFNKNYKKNLYVTTEVDANMDQGVLTINFDDTLAADDIYVNDRFAIQFTLRSEPKEINVYHNNEKQDVIMKK